MDKFGQGGRKFSGTSKPRRTDGRTDKDDRRPRQDSSGEFFRTREGSDYKREGRSGDRRTGSFAGGKRNYGKSGQGERKFSGAARSPGSQRRHASNDLKGRRFADDTGREFGKTREGSDYKREGRSGDRRTGSFAGGKRNYGKSGQGERKFSGAARSPGSQRRHASNDLKGRRFADDTGREFGKTREGSDYKREGRSGDRRTGSFAGGKRTYGKTGPGERKFSGVARSPGSQRKPDSKGRRFADDAGRESGRTRERSGIRSEGGRKPGEGRSSGFQRYSGAGRNFGKLGKSPAGRVRNERVSKRSAAPKRSAPVPVSSQTGIRLNKFIAESGLGSRRTVDEMIAEGRVDVNGVTVSTLGIRIDPEKDKVTVDGETIRKPSRKVYILLNKPKGIITSVSDEKNRTTVIDILNIKDRVFPVGRLDYDTSGLLLLTNDGELANLLMHPSGEIRKTYHAKLSKPLEEKHRLKLSEGVFLEGKRTAECEITYLKKNSRLDVLVTIHEGRNRQVRKIFESYGYFVRELERTVYAGIETGNLKPGEWRMLDKSEVESLYKMTGLRENAGSSSAKDNSE